MNNVRSQPRPGLASGAAASRLVEVSARWGAYALALSLGAGAFTLGFRHSAMAFQQPLAGRGLFLAGVLGAGTAVAARALFRRISSVPGSSPQRGFLEPLVSACLIAWGVALSLTTLEPGGLFLLWSSLVAEEAWAWSTAGRLAPRIASARHPPETESSAEEGCANPRTPGAPETKARDALDSPRILSEPEVMQEFVRGRQSGGGELLRGWVRVPFVPGQRSASVHLAFCPPFESVPSVDIVGQFGPECRIKVVQVLPLGARLDVRLQHASSTHDSVILEILATTEGLGILPDCGLAGGTPTPS